MSQHARWMAAVLACGEGAVLSHSSAAALWRIGRERAFGIDVSLPSHSHRRTPGVRLHRRPSLRASDRTRRDRVPVTSSVQTLIDNALLLDKRGLERMINEADKHDFVHPPELRRELARRAGEPGVRPLRTLLDRRTFRLTR